MEILFPRGGSSIFRHGQRSTPFHREDHARFVTRKPMNREIGATIPVFPSPVNRRTGLGYEQFPDLKQAIADNYNEGRFEEDARAPQAADFAFIERVKAARQGRGE
jgi:hypothetical protein